MNPLLRLLNHAAASFNDLSLWKGNCRVWDLKLTSPGFERWLYLRAHRCGLMGRKDRHHLAQWIRPGMRVLDVGSNVGLYSVLMGSLVGTRGRVICFEPDPVLFQAFRRNCAQNGVDWIEGHNCALGARSARISLHQKITNSGDNHLGRPQDRLFRRTIEVDLVALDTFLPGLEVDFIKIDIQGWELEALRGMQQTLAAQPAVTVYFEFFPAAYQRSGTTWRELVDFLRASGFQISDPNTGHELTDDNLARLVDSMKGMKYTNLLARRDRATRQTSS